MEYFEEVLQLDTALAIVTLLATIVAIAAALSPLVLAIVEAVKMAAKALRPPGVPAELVPALACLVGLVLGLALLAGQPGSDLRTVAIGSFTAGLVASKLFDAGQAKAGQGPGPAPPKPIP